MCVSAYIRFYVDSKSIMESQMKKNMGNDIGLGMILVGIWGLYRGYNGSNDGNEMETTIY